MKRAWLLLVLISALIRGQYADIPDVVTKVATASGNWLKLETGARAVGLGGAYVALGSGVDGIPYNPASVGFLQGQEVFLSQTKYLAGVEYNVLAYGRQVTRSDYVGLHIFYLDSGPMKVTNEYYPNGTGEDFKVTSLSMRFTYARRLTDRLKVGGSVNWLRDDIYTTRSQSVAFDIGSNFDTGIYGFILGMSVTNFGPDVQFGGEGLEQTVQDTVSVDGRLSKVTGHFPIPLTFRLGIRNDLIGPESVFIKSATSRLTLVADGTNPLDYVVTGNMGMEYAWREQAFVRLGTHLGHDTAGLSFGGGIQTQIRGMLIGVDYAFVTYGILDNTQQVSLQVGF
ncbi:MAG: PorV/PorQ family protein [Fidelibacterota bacterium]